MTLRAAVGAVASDARVAEAANAVLQRGGTAADACISAWFAAVGVFPGVLLGPVHLLVCGPGVGFHAYDGSVLQPGLDAPRPRGFRQGEAIPDAAYVAVSCAAHAIATAHAQDGQTSILELASAGVKLAQAEGASSRARLIRRIAEVGPVAMREPAFVRPIIDIAGRVPGGNLSSADLEGPSARIAGSGPTSGLLRVREALVDQRLGLEPVAVCVCDVRGVLAAMHCVWDPSGLPVPPLELTAPKLAVPVRRGVTRITPGQPLPIAAPIAIVVEASVPWAAVGFETTFDPALDSLSASARSSLTLEQLLRGVIDSSHARAALGVLRGTGANASVRVVRVIA
jgi:gamma-glutamyltranspeptidase/glutathione hydrolase